MEQEFRIINPGSRLLMFVILWLISAIAFTGISLLTGMVFFGSDAMFTGLIPPFGREQLSWLRTLQIINQLGLLIIPVFLFALLVVGRRDVVSFVWPGVKLRLSYFLFSFLILLFFIPLVNVLVIWNEGIQLPQGLQGLASWMRSREEAASSISEAFLNVSRYRDLFWNLLIVALLPAIGEEMLFRGMLLPLFSDWTRSRHAGIWLSALLFSAIHMQFFGFFPRLVLGLLLGYAFIRSGSLWLPVLIHLWNNGVIVIVSWFSARGWVTIDEDQLSAFYPVWAVVGGLILGLITLMLVKNTGIKKWENPDSTAQT